VGAVHTPYEGGFIDGRAAATMCSYQLWRDTSTNLPSNTASAGYPAGVSALSTTATRSTYAFGADPQSWPLNGSHFSCEQPLSLNHILRDTWGSVALVGSDYPATHSTSGIFQGEDQEMPTTGGFFSANHTLTTAQQSDPTGSTCADAAGIWEPCSAPGAQHVGGIPNNFENSGGSGCANTYGCPLVDSVVQRNVPLSVFNQSLARILYQQERFGMLGCEQSPPLASCTNPGGIGSDRTGAALLPEGSSGQLGTKNGDAAIVEKYSEEGATLLKNDGDALPLTPSDLAGGILVTGANANHTVADPTNEASTGFIGRDAINPLLQLKALSGDPGAFTFVPANDPTGEPVPNSVLSSDGTPGGLGGLDLSNDGGPPTKDTAGLDRTAVSPAGRLPAGHTYTWTGYLYAPADDTYTFALQQSPSLPTSLNCPQTGQFGTPPAAPTRTLCTPFTAANAGQTNAPPDAVTFSLDGAELNLNAVTANVYGATVPSNPTTAGDTEDALISRTCATGTAATEPGTTNCAAAQSNLTAGSFHQIKITVNNATGCVSTPPAAAAGVNPAVPAVPAPCTAPSFRFGYSRANGDIADAAAAAAGKSKAIVFVNDGVGASSQCPNPFGNPPSISCVSALSTASTNLINAVAAANPNTIVVLNTANPVDTSWSTNVNSILEMWFAGQEGGTSTARVLLGQANPSGHTVLTWPADRNDTIWGHFQNAPLYPGDTTGQHPERLNGNGGCAGAGCPTATGTVESEGIYTGYRYFDKLGITPRLPFGFGLSYTSFEFSKLKVENAADGGLNVRFTVKNTGRGPGADAAQVYVGPLSDRPAGVQFAVRSLGQFERVELAPGASRRLKLHVPPRQLSYWSDAKQEWAPDRAGRRVFVGEADSLSRLPLEAAVKAAHRGDVTCSDQQLNATTIDGDLTVEKGAWCDLVDVTVNGDVQLHKIAGVRIVGATISGDVKSDGPAGAADPLSSGADVICNSTVGGDLRLHAGSAAAPWRLGSCGPNTVAGDVRVDGISRK
jgi:beta-glucosidase